MIYPVDYQLWAGWDVEQAKAWCKQNNLTNEDIKIVKRHYIEGDQILVVTKKELDWV
jgi:phosphoserine phosphatase